MLFKPSTTQRGLSVQKWSEQGTLVHYDPDRKRIVSTPEDKTIGVYEQTRLPDETKRSDALAACWCTFLPGFREGSYGYAKIEREELIKQSPRLYIDYVGQGLSDDSPDDALTVMERANLVEAVWNEHGVRSTVVVACDFSALVVLELLKRRTSESDLPPIALTAIEHVLFVDGIFYPLKEASALEIVQADICANGDGKSGIWFRKRRNASGMQSRATLLHTLEDLERDQTKWDLKQILMSIRKEKNLTFHMLQTCECEAAVRQMERAHSELQKFRPNVYFEPLLESNAERSKERVLASILKLLLRKAANARPMYAYNGGGLVASCLPQPIASSIRRAPTLDQPRKNVPNTLIFAKDSCNTMRCDSLLDLW
jgi:hypothetical protein